MIYLNNAATTFPKPPGVPEAMGMVFTEPSFCLGRTSGGGKDLLFECRSKLARLLSAPDPSRIILTSGTTHALNLAIQGGCKEGRVLTTALEHNSILRPLEHLRRNRGLEVSLLPYEEALDPDSYRKAWSPNLRAIAVSLGSNVNGAMAPLKEIAELCTEKSLILILDAAQGAGSVPLDVRQLPPKSLIALAGHKGLYGPQGTGALFLGDGIDCRTFPPLIFGGTGVKSELPVQPIELPIRYESGTMNLPGFAGLSAALDWVLETGVETIGAHKHRLIQRLLAGLETLPLKILHPPVPEYPTGVLSFVLPGRSSTEIGDRLYEAGIIVRAGLHCAPLIHRDLHCPEGSVRISVGYFNTEADIDQALQAIRALC